MVFVNAARNALRDKMQADVNEAAVGTDGTTASETDTAIGMEVYSDNEAGGVVQSNDGNGGSKWEFTIGLSNANTNTLREVVLRDSGTTTLWVRITHAGILKENNFELDYTISTSFDNTS